MTGEPIALGVDVGGTKIAAASVDDDGTVLERARVPSPSGGAEPLMAALAEVLGALQAVGLSVGVGFAGIVSRDGVVRYGPNVEIVDLPLAARLSDDLGVEVAVLNDATAAAWGEFRAGAAREVDDAVVLTLGTGVGGGIVAGGRLIEGTQGFAGELGHIIVEEAGRRCPCGNRGCLEAYASGTAIELAARERLASAPDAGQGLRGVLRERLGDAPLGQLTGEDVAAAAAAGDALSEEILEEAGRWLGVGLASLVNALDPARVVIGGGAVAGTGTRMLPVARQVMAERILGRAHRRLPEIVEAELGNDAGMVGAALWARASLG